MLEDFIDVNRLSARIARTTASVNAIACELLLADENPVLVIHLAGQHLNLAAVHKETGAEHISFPEYKKVREITGYELGFLPPISMYGVKVLLDEHLLKEKELSCRVSEETTLFISPQEILENNEDCVTGKFAH